MMDEKTRIRVKFQLLEHENDDELADFTLELTNFPRKHLFGLLTSIRDTFTKYCSITPPDEAT